MAATPILNIFRGDAFSNISLTKLVNKVPYVPSYLGKLDLFDPAPLLTTGYAVDRLQGINTLIPVSPRGAPPDQRVEEKRDITYFDVPRLARKTKVQASEIQNVRSLEAPQQLMTVMEMVARKLTGKTGLTKQAELTWENHRLGAVMGIVLDSDGTTQVANYFTKFGIAQPTPVNFDLKNAAAYPDGTLRSQLNAVARTMIRASQGAYIDGESELMALCGDNFFDALINHPDVVETYKNWFEAAKLREGSAFGMRQFGGFTFVNYRGTDDGTTIGVNTNRCQFFINKAPGCFEVAWAPGETFDDVNQMGKPMYIYTLPDPSGKNAFIEFELNSFPLFVNLRPETIQVGLLAAGS